jgi:hypothetical protein
VSPLRLSLTISGSARFGPFEGGALAALIVASQVLGEETLVIDSIASASVGSINDLLTARSLLGGVDPVTLFDAAWVRNASFEDHDTASAESPLFAGATMALASEVLGPHGLPSGPVAARQSEPVRLSMALSNLDRLIGDRPEPEQGQEAAATTIPDWYGVELTSAATPGDFLALVHAASATGSHADRSGPALPDDRPLGRTIDLTEDIGSDDERLHLVIDPDPSLPSIRPSVYDDLLRLERARSHIEWIERVGHAIDDGALDVLAHRGDVVVEARRIMTEREADRSDDYAALLDSLVRLNHNPERHRPGRPCSIESRQHELRLGYRTMRSWLEQRLPAYLPQKDLSTVFDRINQERDRIGRPTTPDEGRRSSAQSLSGMAALGH